LTQIVRDEEKMMNLRSIKAGFVGFGEVNSPRELVEQKCLEAQHALQQRGLELVITAPVRDDPQGLEEDRARAELSQESFDFLVVCLAGWIPSHSVIDVISDFAHKPMVLWGLTGDYTDGRLVTMAAQAGTTGLRDTMDALGFHFKYVYDRPGDTSTAPDQIARFGAVTRAAGLLRGARVGQVGQRDMKLHATLIDAISLRRVVGVEVEPIELLEIARMMESVEQGEIDRTAQKLLDEWQFDHPVAPDVFDPAIRLYLSIMEKVNERGYQAVSVIDVDGVKKLLQFPPALALTLLADQGGVASIPENDGMGAVTQLMVRFLTSQVGAYFEFYEFFSDRLLVGVPDYVPSEVVDGKVKAKLAKFGALSEGVMNESKVRTGKVTLCRLASRGDRYRLHLVTGEAVTPRAWEEAGWAQPAPELPSLEVILDTPISDFAQKVLGQHYIIAYGDYREQFEDLCRLLGIEVI
jgi:L-fucose isomerase-like protein